MIDVLLQVFETMLMAFDFGEGGGGMLAVDNGLRALLELFCY